MLPRHPGLHSSLIVLLILACIRASAADDFGSLPSLRAVSNYAARTFVDKASARRGLFQTAMGNIWNRQRIEEVTISQDHDVSDAPFLSSSQLASSSSFDNDKHGRSSTTTTAARTYVDHASQRSGLLRAIPALSHRRVVRGTNEYDNYHRPSLHETMHVVSIKTQKIRQQLAKTMPNTGFYYGMTPKMVQTHTTDAPSHARPLAMKEAVTMTLEELRSMRQEMESLRDEIRALKRNMLGETEEADPEALLAQKHKKQREYDRIGREVERWAQHLLFEQDGEVDGWKEVACNKVLQSSLNANGQTVAYLKWMKDSRGSHANPDDDREYPCIKVFSTIDAPLDVVCQYLSDEHKMAEYNDLVVEHRELEEIAPHAKICLGQTPAILFIQPRDFVTFCHHRWLRDGTQVIVNQACNGHEDFVAKNPQAYALRGANYISPHPDDPSKTRIALLAHASPGPDVPHWASKTAVKALAPIEPFKLFHKINKGIADHRQELEQALPPAEMVSQGGGRSGRPAGIAQMGYACFWPQGGGLQEEQNVGLMDRTDRLDSMGDEHDDDKN